MAVCTIGVSESRRRRTRVVPLSVTIVSHPEQAEFTGRFHKALAFSASSILVHRRFVPGKREVFGVSRLSLMLVLLLFVAWASTIHGP